MRAATIATRTGLRAWFGRKFELLNVNATIWAAERDRVHLAAQAEDVPKRLRQIDHDLQVLRVQQATLRSGL